MNNFTQNSRKILKGARQKFITAAVAFSMMMGVPTLTGCGATRSTIPEIDMEDTEITTELFGDNDNEDNDNENENGVDYKNEYLEIRESLLNGQLDSANLNITRAKAAKVALHMLKTDIANGATKHLGEIYFNSKTKYSAKDIEIYPEEGENGNTITTIVVNHPDPNNNERLVIPNENISPEINSAAACIAQLQGNEVLSQKKIAERLGEVAWLVVDKNARVQEVDDGKNVKVGVER